MLSAVKEIEAMNRADIVSLMARIDYIETNVLKIKQDKKEINDPMVM
jgi:hypothetical protein